MKSFEQYVKELKEHGADKLVLVSEQMPGAIAGFMTGSGLLPIGEATEFGEKVTELIESEDFISKLSAKIGTPLPNESEEEFIERAGGSLRKVLRERLRS